jgi:4-amino-4-deoxy-L-arabinose transferase-like glycosyltransferase
MATEPRYRDLIILLLLSSVVFLPGIGQRDLWNPDEPRYAEVTREMLETGSMFVPRLNDQIYSEKPPLLFWSIAVASLFTGGVNEVATRLPVALSAIGTVLLVFWLGLQLFNRRAAWLAALAFGTCRKILWQSQDGQIDMLLVFLVTMAVCFWVYGFKHQRPGFSYLFFLAAGLATLAKGPVGLLPPLLSIITFLIVSGRKGEIGSLRIGRGLLIWALVVLAWLLPGALVAGTEYLETMVLKQNVTRFADPWHHFRPWYYYLTVIPGDFFPWALLLPATVVAAWRKLRKPERDGLLLAICWAVVTVVFFSVSPAKRTVYILTMYPAMALIVGAGLDRLAAVWPQHRRWLDITLGLIFVMPALLAGAVSYVISSKPELAVLGPSCPLKATVVMSLLAAGALASWVLMLRGRVESGHRTLAGAMAVWHLAVLFLIVPHVEVLKSARPLANLMSAEMAADEVYGIYPRLDPQFVFYTHRFAVVLSSEEELQEFARRPGRVWLLAKRRPLSKLEEPLPLVEVARDQDMKEGYILFRTPETVAEDEVP